MIELLLFQVGSMQLGTDLLPVRSIRGAPPIVAKQAKGPNRYTPVLDGGDIPLYNLASILGEENSSANPQNEKLIVVKARDHELGLIVDRVDRVVTVGSDRIEPLPPIFKGPALSCFPRVVKHEDGLVLLLAPENIANITQKTQQSQNLRDGLDSEKGDDIRPEVKSADTAVTSNNMKVKTNLLPVVMEKELEVTTTDAEIQIPLDGDDCKQDVDLARMEEIVSCMLPGDQLSAQVERIVAKMIEKSKMADTVRQIFNQTVEDLNSKVMKETCTQDTE